MLEFIVRKPEPKNTSLLEAESSTTAILTLLLYPQ